MKIRTVGLLAAAAMTLTSLSVWSFTPAGGFGERLSHAAESAIPADMADVMLANAWQFSDGDTLKVEARLGHSAMSAAQDNETFLYVNINARGDAVATQQAPVNVAVVIDRSGSMSGKRLRNAIEGAKGMVRELRDGDMVSVITYNDRAETLVSTTPLNAESRIRVAKAIDGIEAAGDTCISCGLDRAMDALRGGSPGMVKRVMLLSDGEATAGIRDVSGFGRLAERARDMGCAISSVGVDVDYNEQIMSTVAQRSNGRHYFVERPAGLQRVFDEERRSLVRTVASNGELRIDLGPGVQLMQVFDRAFRREGNALIVPMGTFTAAENKTVLVKVRVPRGAEGIRQVADINLGFQDLVQGKQDSCQGNLATQLTEDAGKISVLDPLVAARLNRSLTSAALTDANALFKRGDIRGANRLLRQKRKALTSKRAALAKSAPASRRAEVDNDLAGQIGALDAADQAFATPPPSPASPPPQRSRAGKAAVRAAQERAFDMEL